jgi:hypothetical protein
LSHIIIISNSSATFPIFPVPEDSTQYFLARAWAQAAEEHISLSKYLAPKLKHGLRGHDLSRIHFSQDGSGDTYYEPILDRLYDETMAESAAGLSYRCKTAEEGLAL